MVPARLVTGSLLRELMPNEYTDFSPTGETVNSPLQIEQRSASRWLRMNRPGSANALSPDLISAIDLALTQAQSRPDTRAVVVTGVGPVFCGGADVTVAGAMLDSKQPEHLAAYMKEANNLLDRIEDFPLPVIAAVNGAAFAGGLELVLACDLAVAASTAPIGDAHVRHGFVPAWGASWRLPAALGPARAGRLMLTGTALTAADLPEMFAAVVPPHDLEREVMALIGEIVLSSPTAITEIKRLLVSDRSARAASRRREWNALERQLGTSDLAEGFAAFRTGRRPVFSRASDLL